MIQDTWHPGQSAGTQSVPSCTVRPFKMVVLSKLTISDVDEPRICHRKCQKNKYYINIYIEGESRKMVLMAVIKTQI